MSESGLPEPICEPVLRELGIRHGFGVRGSQAPDSTVFPVQVHGARLIREDALGGAEGVPADAILARRAGISVGVVTADCVPILAASDEGRAVVAIHAGWRGLAAGVVEVGLEGLRHAAPGRPLAVAIGPAARGCCYEVDEPVVAALSARYGPLATDFLSQSRPGHHLLDLAGLARQVVRGATGAGAQIGSAAMLCTICGGDRFESHRRDAAAAGRLRHFVTVGAGSHALG